MEQVELVRESLAGTGLRPRRFETFVYLLHGSQSAPSPGAIVETLPGVYWRVLRWWSDAPAETRVALEPIKPHTREAHGPVVSLQGGELL